MAISVTDFKARCLDIIRQVERQKKPVEIVRYGKVVARLQPATARNDIGCRPWERLRGRGTLVSAPDESVLTDSDFEALR